MLYRCSVLVFNQRSYIKRPVIFSKAVQRQRGWPFCSTNVERYCLLNDDNKSCTCCNLLDGIEPVSVFVQKRPTAFSMLIMNCIFPLQHVLNISRKICWSTNVEPWILGGHFKNSWMYKPWIGCHGPLENFNIRPPKLYPSVFSFGLSRVNGCKVKKSKGLSAPA